MSQQLPEPFVHADADLRDFAYTPVYRARLFGSAFHARANDSEWRAGVTLWLKSWDQTPPGSLPDDDIELCRLAELARDLKTWKKLKPGALHGWVKCSDGRLYHKVISEVVNEALKRKQAQRDKTLRARIAALHKRLTEAKDSSVRERITEEISRLSQSISVSVTDDITDPVIVLPQKPREGKGREGKGITDSGSSRRGEAV